MTDETAEANAGVNRFSLAVRVVWVVFWTVLEWVGWKIRDFGSLWAEKSGKVADLGGLQDA